MDITCFSGVSELKNNKNTLNFVYLPGYRNEPDELSFLKERLFVEGYNVESLQIDYEKPFDLISSQIAKYLGEKYPEGFYLMGLSIGAVLAIKLSSLLKDKVKIAICINPFYDRLEVMEKKGVKVSENICVKDFFSKKSPILIISGLGDNKIDPENSRRIKSLGENVELYEIEQADHSFSNSILQNELFRILKLRV